MTIYRCDRETPRDWDTPVGPPPSVAALAQWRARYPALTAPRVHDDLPADVAAFVKGI